MIVAFMHHSAQVRSAHNRCTCQNDTYPQLSAESVTLHWSSRTAKKVSGCCKMCHHCSVAIPAAPASHIEAYLAGSRLLAAASLDLAADSCHMHSCGMHPAADNPLAATDNCFVAAASGTHLAAVAADTPLAAHTSLAAATDTNLVAAAAAEPAAEPAAVVAIHCSLAATGMLVVAFAAALALSHHLSLLGHMV